MGGTLAAIERGFQQRQIQESAYRVQQAIERGDQVVVGVNRFRDDEARERPPTPADRPRRRAAPGRARPAGPRRARPRAAWDGRACAGSSDAARGDEQPACRRSIEAVSAYATVGEISDRLRAAWGEHRELITV